MSASASKKNRQQRDEQGFTQQELHANKNKEQESKKKLGTIIFCAVAVLAVALVVILALIGAKQADARRAAELAPDYDTSLAAATVGSYNVTVPEYNYFYNSNINSNAQLYMYFYGLQTNIPLRDQTYGDGTFEDLFKDQTKTTIGEYINLYQEAVENGITLTAEDEKIIEDSMKDVKETAKKYGFNKVDYYLGNVFGPGCNEENYRQYLEMTKLVSTYYTMKEESCVPTADEVRAEYAANPDKYDKVTVTVYTVNAESTPAAEEGGEPTYTDEALEKAKADAEAAVINFPTEETNTVTDNKEYLAGLYGDEAGEWLLSPDRKAGDVKSFPVGEDGHSYNVVRFDSRDDNSYNLVNAYVVAISRDVTAQDESGASISPATDTIVERIKSRMPENMTDEAFEKLITDNGYTATAKDITKGTYQDDIYDYLYSADRKAGDFDVFSNNNFYYIVRYVSESETTYQYSLVSDALKDQKLHEWYDVASVKNEVIINEDVLVHANTNITLYSNSQS